MEIMHLKPGTPYLLVRGRGSERRVHCDSGSGLRKAAPDKAAQVDARLRRSTDDWGTGQGYGAKSGIRSFIRNVNLCFREKLKGVREEDTPQGSPGHTAVSGVTEATCGRWTGVAYGRPGARPLLWGRCRTDRPSRQNAAFCHDPCSRFL